MNRIAKTNAARLLDGAAIPYELIPYRVDEEHLDAVHVARELGEPAGQVFKTLVLRGERRGVFVCVVPGDREVDLKRAAEAAGDKRAAMVHVRELLPLTGYVRGGCSPLGMKRSYPIYFHRTCLDYPHIYVSAGARGLQLRVAPGDLLRLTGAEVADLVRE